MLKLIRSAALVLMLVPSIGQAQAQDFDKGMAAYNAKDYITAFKEFRPLAELGNPVAQYYLSIMYNNGQSVIQDYSESLKWNRRSAEQGYARAQLDMGLAYWLGMGVTSNDLEALKWFRLSAEQGNADAQFYIGNIYETAGTDDTAEDDRKAHMWYNLSATNGRVDGFSRRDELARRMSSNEISEAVANAKVCLDSGYKDCDFTYKATEVDPTAQKKAAAAERPDVNAFISALLEASPETQKLPEGSPMTQAEIDGLRVAINKCWNIGQLSSEALRIIVTLRVEMSGAGKPTSVEMTNYEGGSEAAAREAFEAGRRSIMRCAGGNGFDLSPDKYGQWAVLTMIFDLDGMRLR